MPLVYICPVLFKVVFQVGSRVVFFKTLQTIGLEQLSVVLSVYNSTSPCGFVLNIFLELWLRNQIGPQKKFHSSKQYFSKLPITMSTNNVEESMSMFFDDEFNPSTYIDKLVTSVTQQNSTTSTTPSTYSKQSLTKLSHTINQLITHVDYYVSDIANNSLHEKLEMLDKSSTLIHTSNASEEQGGTSRLQYHLNILDNSIISLQSELTEINNTIELNESINNEAVQTLIQLKLVKNNLITVIDVLETMNNSLSKVNENKLTYTVDEFQLILDELLGSIKQQLSSTGDNSVLLAHIAKLINLQNVFLNLNNFNPVYKRFITKLITERDTYLKRLNTWELYTCPI